MNWFLALIGAFVGAALSSERSLFGFAVGALLGYVLGELFSLRQKIEQLARQLEDAGEWRQDTAARPSAPVTLPTTRAASPADPEAAAAAAQQLRERIEAEERELSALQQARQARVSSSEIGTAESADIAAPRASPPPIPEQPALHPKPAPGMGRIPMEPVEPDWEQRLAMAIKRWFTEGNVPVKIGVLVLFAGVAAALRYAAEQGFFTFPIEFRIAAIAALAFVALGLGWRERERKPAFGLSLQGGAIGVLLLTVFASYNYYHLLPAGMAFALVVVLVAGAALLSVLQGNMPLATLGFLGGYLAPVLIDTGSNNYVGLFSYYAVLNAAVFGISWKRSWRLLNLIGFFFTFGVGSAWGIKSYQPEYFATVEPFLILFFVFYLVIGLLYVIRQTEHRKPWVDGTLVFGTPMVAFPLQAAMLKDDRLALAFSALAVAVIYAGLVYYLRRRRDERLLTEAYGALALGFATLAIPLAFSAGTTATLWSLEGAGVAWLGIRQKRTFPWVAGLLLQLLAAGAYVTNMVNLSSSVFDVQPLLLNPVWLGAAFLAFSGYVLSVVHDRHKPSPMLSALLFAWATFWWLAATFSQVDKAAPTLGEWQFLMLAMVSTLVLATASRSLLSWLRLNWLVLLCAIAGGLMIFHANEKFGSPLAAPALPLWLMYVAAMLWTLWAGRELASRSLSLAHLLALWSLVLASSLQLEDFSQSQQLAQGWEFLAVVTPLAMMTWSLWRHPGLLAWPREPAFSAYYSTGWFALALPLLAVAVVAGLFLEGSATPLPYVPVFNPLELTLLALAILLFSYAGESDGMLNGMRRLWPYVGFVFITLATLRAVHHGHGEPWGMRVLQSGFSQASLTVVWSLTGVGGMLLGSRRAHRPLWMGGMILMVVVLAKLALVDRQYMSNIPGIVSFLAVGLLLVGVGYFAPSPPRNETGSP